MLYQFRYKNKKRYNYEKKKNVIYTWERSNKKEDNYIQNSNKFSWKNIIGYSSIYKSLKLYNNYLVYNNLKEINYMDWTYKMQGIWKKRPFTIHLIDRNHFFQKIQNCLDTGDNLQFIKNCIYDLYDKSSKFFKVLDVLNFYWLYAYKNKKYKILQKEKFMHMGIKSFFLGFLKKGLKRQCEIRFFNLLILLKKKLNKAGLHLMSFFIKKLWPLVGFRRQKLNKRTGKKKIESYFYKLNRHNLRWKSLLFRRFCLNSPFYIRKGQFVSVLEIYNGLLQAIYSKGPIVKCLNVYYRLIKKRTPHDKNKKKKKNR